MDRANHSAVPGAVVHMPARDFFRLPEDLRIVAAPLFQVRATVDHQQVFVPVILH